MCRIDPSPQCFGTLFFVNRNGMEYCRAICEKSPFILAIGFVLPDGGLTPHTSMFTFTHMHTCEHNVFYLLLPLIG